jgi:hypothetical protein
MKLRIEFLSMSEGLKTPPWMAVCMPFFLFGFEPSSEARMEFD